MHAARLSRPTRLRNPVLKRKKATAKVTFCFQLGELDRNGAGEAIRSTPELRPHRFVRRDVQSHGAPRKRKM